MDDESQSCVATERESERRVTSRNESTDSQSRKRAVLEAAEYELTPDCSEREFLAVAKVYAREVADVFDLTVSVSDLEWEVSKRAKRRAGAVKYRDDEPLAVVLTWRQFEQRGWKAMASTIRHELLHVHLLNEGVGPGHGREFERLAEQLETTVNCERFAEPKWWVECRECSARLARYRRSKLVESPDQYRCRDCGGRFEVTHNNTD